MFASHALSLHPNTAALDDRPALDADVRVDLHAPSMESRHVTPSASAAEMAAMDEGSPLSASPSPRLPREVWGEVASFCARRDILNLRAVGPELQCAIDDTVTTMTLKGNEQLRMFMDARGFANIETLRLKDTDSDGIAYLAERFAARFSARVDTPLKLELNGSDLGMAQSIVNLQRLPLAGLRIHAAFMARGAVAALINCVYPVQLQGLLSTDKLLAASCIGSLTSLRNEARFFDDGMARVFSDQPALESLACLVSSSFSARGAASIALIPKLRVLDLDLLSGEAITPAAARVWAAKPGLETLRLLTHFQPVPEESISILAASETLQRLRVNGVSYPLRGDVT